MRGALAGLALMIVVLIGSSLRRLTHGSSPTRKYLVIIASVKQSYHGNGTKSRKGLRQGRFHDILVREGRDMAKIIRMPKENKGSHDPASDFYPNELYGSRKANARLRKAKGPVERPIMPPAQILEERMRKTIDEFLDKYPPGENKR
jgi:hypothetical protein